MTPSFCDSDRAFCDSDRTSCDSYRTFCDSYRTFIAPCLAIVWGQGVISMLNATARRNFGRGPFMCALVLAVAALGVGGPGCSDSGDSASRTPQREWSVLRLNESLDRAMIKMPRLDDMGSAEPSSMRELLIEYDFELEGDPGAKGVVSGEILTRGIVKPVSTFMAGEGWESSRGLMTSPRGWGAGFLHEVEKRQSYECQFRVRFAEGSKPNFDHIVKVHQMEKVTESLYESQAPIDQLKVDQDSLGKGWYQVRVNWQCQDESSHVAVVISTRSSAIVDDFALFRLSPVLAFVAKNEREAADFPHPLRTVVSLGNSHRDAMFLLPPCEVSYGIDIPESAPVLKAALGGRVLGKTQERTRVSLTVNDQEVWSQDLTPESDIIDYRSFSVDLRPWAGTAVELVWKAQGGEDLVPVVAHPTLVSGHPSPEQRPPNLVMISLDTLRADHLGTYGYERAISPRLDQLGREGVVVEKMHATSSYTLPTHVSLFTGVSPLVHGAKTWLDRASPNATPFLAARLQAHDYQTAAFTGGGFVDPKYGFSSGFERYEVYDPGLALKSLRDRAVPSFDLKGFQEDPSFGMIPVLDWLDRAGEDPRPFFLFLHTFLVHEYRPRLAYLEAILRLTERNESRAQDETWEQYFLRSRETKGVSDVVCQGILDLYDATILQADEIVIGAILDQLEAMGVSDSTVVCVLSDHGEEFMEHGRIKHALTLYQEVIHVPWILRGPGLPPGTRYTHPISSECVMPTLLELLGVSPTSGDFPKIQIPQPIHFADPAPPSTPIVSHLIQRGTEFLSLRNGANKIIRSRSETEELWELYDLGEDPWEAKNLYQSESKESLSLSRRMSTVESALNAYGRGLDLEQGSGELSPEMREQLKALGYLEDG